MRPHFLRVVIALAGTALGGCGDHGFYQCLCSPHDAGPDARDVLQIPAQGYTRGGMCNSAELAAGCVDSYCPAGVTCGPLVPPEYS